MANYNALKNAVQQVIRKNGNNEITGEILQSSLISIINSLGDGYQFMGTAKPDDSPAVSDQRVFYIATTPGVYSDFGGYELAQIDVAILYYDDSWHFAIPDIANRTAVNEAIDNEVEQRIAEDAKIAESVTNEVDARKNDVAELQGQIVAETTAREDEDREIRQIIAPLRVISIGVGTGTSAIIANNKLNTASGDYSFAEGDLTKAMKRGSHSEGAGTTASAISAHAEGEKTTASGRCSHSEGYGTIASGPQAHAEGDENTASGDYSHAEGYSTKASASSAHSEGALSAANATSSHAEGANTVISTFAGHAQGKYNEDDTNAIHIIGIGSSVSARKNSEIVYTDGKKFIIDVGDYDGTKSSIANGAKSIQEVISGIQDDVAKVAADIITLTITQTQYNELVANGSYTIQQSEDWDFNSATAKASMEAGTPIYVKIVVMEDSGTVAQIRIAPAIYIVDYDGDDSFALEARFDNSSYSEQLHLVYHYNEEPTLTLQKMVYDGNSVGFVPDVTAKEAESANLYLASNGKWASIQRAISTASIDTARTGSSGNYFSTGIWYHNSGVAINGTYPTGVTKDDVFKYECYLFGELEGSKIYEQRITMPNGTEGINIYSRRVTLAGSTVTLGAWKTLLTI